MARTGLALAALFILLSFRCVVEDDTVETADAYSEVYAAIQFKARQCGNMPAYFLPIPKDPPSYGTRLCSLSILRQDCPFRDYPLFCVEMLGLDLPGIGP